MGIVVQQIWGRTAGELWFYLILLISIYIIYTFKNYIRIIRFIFSLNGPPTLPLLGNAGYVYDANLLYKISHTAYNDYGSIFRIWVTLLPYVVLYEPEDIQIVLGSMKHTEKIFFYRLLHNFLGKGLITRDTETWKSHRKLLQPAFHLHILERFSKSFSECSNHLVEKFLHEVNKEINITTLINDSVYDILNEVVLGITLADKKSKEINGNDVMPFRKGQVLMPYRLVRPWLLIDWIYKRTKVGKQEQQQREDLFNACRKIMAEKREFIQKNGSIITDNLKNATRKMSLLEYMVEINERTANFSDEDIINECCTFMLAGQDSVGTATAITMFLLANHQDWQSKCVKELEDIFGSDERSPTMQDLRDMRCLEMCIKEALRLYPSVPFFARTLGEDVKIGKKVIPAGCGVFIMPYGVHRLPHHFPNPHTFNPERFNSENSGKRHPYAYLPFSAGPRNCIGHKFAILEIKSMISAVLRKCQLGLVSDKNEVLPKFRVTVRAHGGLWVKVMSRSN